ncbi:hypothetical protein [Sphingomonas oryzagri]|uniref:Uncharacterized protein n=1 Tax=Sphingomonas oryzagri TaxID=3042314 RepID=A0ABT6MZE3_9SPHN|nr:hypothetical protein [Sphingomonas oryzagri]MDH7638430.1 hypothetical protein [Sphingomonas oryzagri]
MNSREPSMARIKIAIAVAFFIIDALVLMVISALELDHGTPPYAPMWSKALIWTAVVCSAMALLTMKSSVKLFYALSSGAIAAFTGLLFYSAHLSGG